MLVSLHVRNFAIIDEIDVEFDAGMTVLTGETGAGKSILVDALGLVLGERGGTGLTRLANQRAEFSAEFDVSGLPDAREWLAEHSLDTDDECLLRRVIGDDGRSRAFVNGNAVPLHSLKALGDKLIDIHGQHFHQSLGRRDVQRDLLDYYGELQGQRGAASSAWAHWRRLAQQLRELEDAESNRASRLDLLEFQTRERERFRHGGQLVEGVTNALQVLYEGDAANAQGLLAEAGRLLAASAAIDPALGAVRAMIEEAAIQVAEAADALQRYGDELDLDPERRDRVEERLDAIRGVARKHRVEADELPVLLAKLRQQLDDIVNAEATSARLRQETREARDAFLEVATLLSAARRESAIAFAAEVTDAMRALGMPEGVFEVDIRTRAADDAGASGLDDVTYLISANAGQAPMPLSRVASGGELSRMSLAIQVIASDGSTIPTMVFDEVDAGVGGGVAEMVGRRLMSLGESRQVLCVTHLPQVASLADNHFRVLKISDGKTTRTGVTRLNENERIEEIARMLGGVKITKRTRDHAAEMLADGRRDNCTALNRAL